MYALGEMAAEKLLTETGDRDLLIAAGSVDWTSSPFAPEPVLRLNSSTFILGLPPWMAVCATFEPS